MKKKIYCFNFPKDHIINGKYKILEKLGEGWEGEVYKVKEISTNIERAIKFFLPARNIGNKAARFYAKKLHKLRSCPILIQYLTQDYIFFYDQKVTFLISEYVEGVTLEKFLETQKGKRLTPFQALLFIHSLVKGVEEIHGLKEYHGDLHTDNIIVQRYGLGFELKLLDMFHWGPPKQQNFRDELFDIIRILYDITGGSKKYSSNPMQIKEICCGLKKTLILKKFKNLNQFKVYLENISWD